MESIEFSQLDQMDGYDGAEGDNTGEPQIGYMEFDTDEGFPIESEIIIDRQGISVMVYEGNPHSPNRETSIWFKRGSSVEETTQYAMNNLKDGMNLEDLKRLGFEKQTY